MENKIYIIWIWWIWISAIARYYNSIWYNVYWSDKYDSELIKDLKNEWINIVIWERPDFIESGIEKIIYTEAIPENQSELVKWKKIWIKTITYPEALANIANDKKLIAVTWTHWKSTTTSLISLILKNSEENFTSIVWTLLKEFWNKNFYHRSKKEKDEEYFTIEACEYKRSFLKYKPSVLVITNIEIDHLDYYKDLDDYILAFRQIIDNVKVWWFVIINWQEENSRQLINYRQDLNYIIIDNDKYEYNWQIFSFPKIDLKVPWEHILYDARIAFIVGQMLWIKDDKIISTLNNYDWVWRRMEKIWLTGNNNLVMSDYWHHPTEIKLTLESIKKSNIDKEIIVVFQPHQYNRTIELINDFKDSFDFADKLIIPNIYESRDSELDKKNMSTEIFINKINHVNKINWNWLENTLKLINEYDSKNTNSIIILMWAWDVDNLRYKIKTK